MKTALSYICNTDDIQTIKRVGTQHAIIQRKGETKAASYVCLNNGTDDFFVQARLPFIKNKVK